MADFNDDVKGILVEKRPEVPTPSHPPPYAPSRKECVINDQMTEASNKWAPSPPIVGWLRNVVFDWSTGLVIVARGAQSFHIRISRSTSGVMDDDKELNTSTRNSSIVSIRGYLSVTYVQCCQYFFFSHAWINHRCTSVEFIHFFRQVRFVQKSVGLETKYVSFWALTGSRKAETYTPRTRCAQHLR